MASLNKTVVPLLGNYLALSCNHIKLYYYFMRLFLLSLLFLFTLCTLFTVSACHKKAKSIVIENMSAQMKADQDLIAKYLKAQKWKKYQHTPTGIVYRIDKEGVGANPTINSKVEVHYRGTLLDGSEFDSSYARGQTITFPLKNLIVGWQQGIPLLKPGGKGTFIIPSELAYGGKAVGNIIKPNSVLVFEIELF
ncbi:MAG TPA: FKBP-type peptidyl-prolyl cis-trans isomerase [Chitinophagales bacterium]|jgi:FKBP-type peptidyl-prolyl cis-trans isomerase|nr:FKBP-type peptidyl-prolyl cis-trans isomerase [Chitinophagales bacterium]